MQQTTWQSSHAFHIGLGAVNSSGDCTTGACYLYGRSWSPTVHTLGRQLAALEDTEAAYAVSSGMAAVSSAILALCNSGDHVMCSNCVYGGTYAFMKSYLPQKCGISTTMVDISDLKAVEAAFSSNTKVVYTEVLSNPTLVIADLPSLAQLAHQHGASLVVDNTFTPLAVTPCHWGADVVVHSMTKFMSGSSDIIAGAVCGRASLIQQMMDLHTGPVMLQGPTMDPRIASELLLRLPHLHLRMAEHSRRAQAMADMLAELGAKVLYPGLPGHKQHDVLTRLLNPGYGYGGLIGIDMGTAVKAEALMERLQNRHGFGLMAVSLGYADTLMSLSAASTSSEMDQADLEAAEISTGYVRMSVGITGSLPQRLAQLQEAYTFVTNWNGMPPYRATKVRRQANGMMMEVLSWPSSGPQEDAGPQEPDSEADNILLPEAAEIVAAACAASQALLCKTKGPLGAHEGAIRPASSQTTSNTLICTDTAASSHASASRLRPSPGLEDCLERPVKYRRLDDETHVVYTPLGTFG
eukprot:GHRR01013854.1.p1 GENE.GHRR01013854.1~~GHRR01013854.1.p1  ORF type:complete len:524 (+),score=184.92 GHRR01013854.1:299-1870(+)